MPFFAPLIPLAAAGARAAAPYVGRAVASKAGGSAASKAAGSITAGSVAKFGGRALAQGALMKAGSNMLGGDGGGQQQAPANHNPFDIDMAAQGSRDYTALMQPGQFG